MSHSPTSYIEGVPVKISERYKPPPKISLPQKIVNCLANCNLEAANNVQSNNKNAEYDFHLERHAQMSLASWRNQRHQERFARKERSRQRQIDRQRQQDEHQKQLLTAVSYPNAEDLSSDEDEDADASPEESSSTQSEAGTNNTFNSSPDAQNEVAANNMTVIQESKPRFDTILMPTVMAGTPNSDSGWSFLNNQPNGALSSNSCSEITNRYTSSSAMAKINYSDFENDTSSPFDNVELKTIDDLDILAQVLKQNYLSNPPEFTAEQVSGNVDVEKDNGVPINNQNHSQIVANNQTTSSILQNCSSTHPINENALNSNGESSQLQHQPTYVVNHSGGFYPNSQHSTSRQYYYDNRNQSYSPTQPQLIYANTAPNPIQQQQQQFVYYNYHNQTLANNLNHTEQHVAYNSQKYAAPYGVHVPQHSSLSSSAIGPDTAIKSNSVPDILRQLNNQQSSSGNALH